MATVSTSNQPTNVNSLTGGVVIITIPNPAADTTYGSSLPCRTCLVMQQSGTQTYMNIDEAAASGTGWKLSGSLTYPIEVAVDDVNKLHFIGTAADKVQILYRL